MKLKQLLLNHSWSDVRNKILEIYPEQLKNIKGYEQLYSHLTQMEEKTINMTIQINKYFYDDSEKDAVDLIGYYNDQVPNDPEQQYALAFTPWNKWIGMEINNVTLAEYSQTEIIAHCLYEMTFWGFNEDEIQSSWE